MKKVFKAILLLTMVFYYEGCAYRLGAETFMIKEKTETSGSAVCNRVSATKVQQTVTKHKERPEVVVLKEPSEADPVLILFLGEREVTKKQAKVLYECKKKI